MKLAAVDGAAMSCGRRGARLPRPTRETARGRFAAVGGEAICDLGAAGAGDGPWGYAAGNPGESRKLSANR